MNRADFSMFHGGAWTRVERALGLLRRNGLPSLPGIALVSVALWAPLVILTSLQSGSLTEALRLILGDFTTTVRCLVTVPILLFAGQLVDRRISLMLRGMMAEELIPPSHMAAWDAAVEKAKERATGGAPLLILAALALAASIFLPPPPASEAWTMIGEGHARISWAGIWHAAVSRPIPLFLVLLWLWRWATINLFALAVAKLPLQLRMGHPDQVGGLAVLGDFAVAATPMILASSAVVSANLAWQMVNRGTLLTSLGAVIAGFVVLSVFYGLGPQLYFAPALTRLRLQARIAYGALAARHARMFEDRWFVPGETASELLGAPEISSLQDLATSYQLARGVRLLPLAKGTVVALLISALIPMLPLVLLEASPKEILVRLLKFLV